MTTSNRAELINATMRVLKKHFKPVPPPKDRTVLVHWIYACCLENARYEEADKAFKNIVDMAFDWNEMRVTTVTELAEQMSNLPDARRSASKLKRVLQSVFESQYSYDLEHLKKQNLGKTVKDMLRHDGATKFQVSYVTQHALDGHSLPIDEGALDVMYIVGVIDEKERAKHVVPGLERAIPKKQGIEYGSLLHQMSAELFRSPYSPEVRDLLLAINPDARPRLPKRQRKKKPVEKTPAKVSKTKVAAKPKAEKKPKTKKAAAKPLPVKKKAKKKTPSKAARKKTSSKKSATKQLTKRKPR
jgi:hypothetical protein